MLIFSKMQKVTYPFTLFRTEASARDVYDRGEMTESDGFFVVCNSEGRYVIEVRDPDDGLVLGCI